MKILAISSVNWYLYNYRMAIHKILMKQGYETVMVSPPGRYDEKFSENGFKWLPVNISRSGIGLYDQIKSTKELRKIIQSEKPDIIHNFQMKGNVLGTFSALKAGHSNIVNSITGLGYVFTGMDLKAKLLNPIGTLLYKIAMTKSKVIFQNKDDLDNFVKKKIVKKENAFLIQSSGVELDRFTYKPLPDESKPFTVLFPSRLIWTKGVGDLVEAAKIVRAKYPDIIFCFAGDIDRGNPASLKKEHMENWVKKGIIEWVGFESNMPERMAKAHVIGFPSKHPEGTPKCLIEAAACGRPIVTTNNRGCTEVVKDGYNGLIVEKNDIQGLANAIIRLYNDRILMKQMGEAGRKIAEEKFSVERVAYNTSLVYKSFFPFVSIATPETDCLKISV
jgi:glycosyltransferase involved in cell wall biosynthesis